MPLLSPKDAVCVEWLEVDPQHQLDHAPTNIVRGGKILVGGGGLTKSRGTKISDAGISRGLAADLEVDVIKSIQELSPHLNVHPFCDLGLLDDADREKVRRQGRQEQRTGYADRCHGDPHDVGTDLAH